MTRNRNGKPSGQRPPQNNPLESPKCGLKPDTVYSVAIQPKPEDEARNTDEKTYRNKQLGIASTLNKISAIAVLVTALGLLGLFYNWRELRETNRIARESTDRAYRPYIGINSISAYFGYTDAAGVWHTTRTPGPEAKSMTYTIEIKNFGPVPGLNYKVKWAPKIDNRESDGGRGEKDTPFTLFPGQSVLLGGDIGTDSYPGIMHGTNKFTVQALIEYDYPSGHSAECTRFLFDSISRQFWALGSCEDNPETKA